jgi:hypothetical protein
MSEFAPAENELLRMIIRSAHVSAGATAVTAACDGGPSDGRLRVQATETFAGEVTAGRVPSARTIRARLHVGQPRAQRVRAYLATFTNPSSRPAV